MSGLDLSSAIAVVGAVRTPIGAIGGSLASFQAYELANLTINRLLSKSKIEPHLIQYTSFGWVMQDPRCPNLAKTAAELAGVSCSVPGTTFHENCASGGAAVHDVMRRILVGDIDIGIAGGVEAMSNVPRYLYDGRIKSQLYGDFKLNDGIMGSLADAFAEPKGALMGLLTEKLVEKYNVTREQQDEVAYQSHQNALKAWSEGMFADYVFPVELKSKRGKKGKADPVMFEKDEGPRDITKEQLAGAKAYFKPEGGTITPANSSSINDGCAALILMSSKKAESLGIEPLGYIAGYHNIGVQRELMGEGAFKVIAPLLAKVDLELSNIDYLELNEAFAAVVGAALNHMPDLDASKVNQWGSGISLGHPVGCTGARQIVDMIYQLKRREAKLGLTSRCVGGGMGSAEVIVVK